MTTCLACYGHPGVFVYPSHEAIRRARAEGYEARMLPGISAEDCLFADLGVDPGISGCQSYEATDFMANARRIDPTSSVILWQIGVVGDATFKRHGYDLSAFPLLIERLLEYYPPTHVTYLYEAAIFPGCEPVIHPVPIQSLGSWSFIMARPGLSDDAAYRVAKALHQAEAGIAQRLAQGKETTAANTAAAAPRAELIHPGVRRYLGELGLLTR